MYPIISTTVTSIIRRRNTTISNSVYYHMILLFVLVIITFQTKFRTSNLINIPIVVVPVVASFSLLNDVVIKYKPPLHNYYYDQYYKSNNQFINRYNNLNDRIKQRTCYTCFLSVILRSTINDDSIVHAMSLNHNCYLQLDHIVQQHEGFSQRFITIPINSYTNNVVQPIIAEVFVNQQCILVQIISMIVSSSSKSISKSKSSLQKIHQEPKFQVKLLSSLLPSNNNSNNNEFLSSLMIIDIGQIITIWEQSYCTNNNNSTINDVSFDELMNNPVYNSDDIENILDQLYHTTRRGMQQQQATSKIWSKQHINQLIEREFGNDDNATNNDDDINNEKVYTESVLRKIQKAGMNYYRIIDSMIVMEHLFPNNKNYNNKNNNNHPTNMIKQRAISALILSNDGKYGGRFKRWPCMYISTSSSIDNNITNISIINGGWFVTDTNVRIGLEAQKFANKVNHMINDNNNNNTNIATCSPRTIADERIYRRLECLAMGELMSSIRRDNQQQQVDDNKSSNSNHPITNLELDVREVLRTMNLPINPDGAKQALIRTGYWSNDISKQQKLAQLIQPWSQSILDSAKWYSHTISSNEYTRNDLTTRIDLTNLPCVCVDAAKTTFRDDAIGVRPREMMGRSIIPGASKWEILIHITDVSDIYTIPKTDGSDNNVNEMSMIVKSQNDLTILRNAAASRGTSRYDLPLGPLHLLPPIVLHALSFPATNKETNDIKQSSISRCVTVWAYIDERNGQLLDYGIERTIISSPIILSFSEATDLLDGKSGGGRIDSGMNPVNKAQAILMVVERNLKLWEMYDRQKNIVAQKREVRLMKREQMGEQQQQDQSIIPMNNTNQKVLRDDGVDGFRRTRGHRLIDTSLNLYSLIAIQLLEQAKAPIPYVIGAHYKDRGGRFGTAPLRRYMDGQIQRQILAILFNYGQAMTKSDCKDVSMTANNVNNAIHNIRSLRKGKK